MSYVLERRVKTLEDLVTGLTAPELLFLDGVTAGTATASKAVVLNSSKGISTITSATITTLTAPNMAGSVVFADGTTDVDIASHDGTNGLKLGGTLVTATAAQVNFVSGVTAGTALASKALVLGASKEIATITSATITTLTSTTVTAGTVTNTAINIPMLVRQSADVTKDDGAAASALTGLVQTVVAGTYYYRANLQLLSTANAGAKITMDLTTAALTSLQNVARAFTASAVACARSTTTTDNAVLYGATAAITQIQLEGTMVVSTGGTIQLNAEQNASHADESIFYAGSTWEMIRIA